MTIRNPFAFPKPITLDDVLSGRLLAHHRSAVGLGPSFRMEDPPKDDPPKDDPPKDDPPKDDPPKPDPDDPDQLAKDPAKFEERFGFPPKTPVEQMNPSQEAAYWKHTAKVVTGQRDGMLKLTGGKYGKDLEEEFKEHERLRKAQQTDQERAIEEAKEAGKKEALGSTLPSFARTLLGVALAHVDEDRRKVLVSSADVSTLIVDGEVDTDKVTALAQALAPSDTGTGGPNYGGGGKPPKAGTGVASGRSRFQEEQERKNKGKKAAGV